MLARLLLAFVVAATAILVSDLASTQAQADWNGDRYVEILLLDEGGNPLTLMGACFIIWSREGPMNPLQVCDNVQEGQVPTIDPSSYEGGAVVATGMSDLDANAGVIWVDVSSIGPGVLITESIPLQELGSSISCATEFAPCSPDGSETRIGQTTTFTYGNGIAEANPAEQIQPAAALDCEIVELYPGYPGYRGVVTGLVGKGDTACLADLQAAYPTFSRDEQDAANRRVAQSLGIGGDFPIWTWEIWMAIGAQRGYGGICYSCMWLGVTPVAPIGPGVLEPNDPRLVLSGVDTHLFEFDYMRRHGASEAKLYVPITDGQLRVIASAIQPGHYPTTEELIAAADYVVEVYSCVSEERCGYFGGSLICTMAQQGGHVPVSAMASLDDQVGILSYGVLAAADAGSGAWGTELPKASLTYAWNSWTMDSALTPTAGGLRFANYVSQAFGC